MIKRLCFMVALALSAFVAAAAQHGINVDDMNRDGAACTDFFDYANGGWRKANAIPDYMDRWSRRWQSGELNKSHVRDILVNLSSRTDWPRGSAEQLSGDYYAACMDESHVDQLGIAPLMPLLNEIRAIKRPADLQKAIRDLQDVGVQAPFVVYARQDLHDPTRVIAQVDAAGLGLPDRDY